MVRRHTANRYYRLYGNLVADQVLKYVKHKYTALSPSKKVIARDSAKKAQGWHPYSSRLRRDIYIPHFPVHFRTTSPRTRKKDTRRKFVVPRYVLQARNGKSFRVN